jgi:transketolase
MSAAFASAPSTLALDQLCINTLRFLSVDAVQKANSGHPGLPLGAAPMAYVLWTRFLKHHPANPEWFDRDRFVLSAGHGSMLLYSLLHLSGYDLALEQIEQFRQWGSITPGHPERGVTPGVEVTTGPLGQGFGNAVGMAMAEAHLAARYNRPGFEIVDHRTYAIVSDGDLMEGVASESASLAGHLRLGKLIYLYDNNHVTLSAGTDITFTEDCARRFEAYGWHTQSVDDGNDVSAIDRALRAARGEQARPSLILVRTHIGYGSPNKQDSFEAHGSPLGVDEVCLTKQNLGWPTEPPFLIPEPALAHFREALACGARDEAAWNDRMAAYAQAFPDLAQELRERMRGELPPDWDADIPVFPADVKGIATRVASSKVMNAVASRLPALTGGSADLDPSTYTALKGFGDFHPPAGKDDDTQGSAGGGWTYGGRNLHFGVREHAMGAAVNGLALHGGIVRPYGSTFLIFSDCMRPAIRLSALMQVPVAWVFTHDSVGLGEDGPTHQPVELYAALRAIPGLTVLRPAEAAETADAWRVILEEVPGPACLLLTRQRVPVLDRGEACALAHPDVARGGYILAEAPARADAVIVATGSEVAVALAARDLPAAEGDAVRVVSMPSWELFAAQDAGYRETVLPTHVPTVALEAGVPLGWCAFADRMVVSTASAPPRPARS